MNEAEFWSTSLRGRLVKACQELSLRHHFERVENGVADGTPDVDYCIKGKAGKIELKYTDSHPVRTTSQVLQKGKGLRRSQIIFASKRVWAGGSMFCIIGTPQQIWCVDLRPLDPPAMDALATASVDELSKLARWDSSCDSWQALPFVLSS